MTKLNPQFQSNFTRGEVSEYIGCRPDLAGYFNGLSVLENFLVYPEGGATSDGTGSRFFAGTKFNNKLSIGIDFVFNVTQTYHLEVGDLYTRIYRGSNREYITDIVTPWFESNLLDLQWAQSADVLYVVHPSFQTRQINRVSDTSWNVTLYAASPPPSFEADTDISNGASITPSGTTGSITITASGGVFLEGDVGRQIIAGSARAIISAFSDTSNVTATVLSSFPNTNPIFTGSWFVRGSPGVSLDVDKRGPVGAQVNLDASNNAWRTQDVGKFVRIYGGIIKIFQWNSTVSAYGEIMSTLTDTDDENPATSPPGAWTLEEESWNDTLGWPSCICFSQGRLTFMATNEQPTTFWQSAVDDYNNLGRGVEADSALEFTLASRRVNKLQWCIAMGQLFLGDAESEYTAKGPGVDVPLGGDTVPFINEQGDVGSRHIQPIIAHRSILFSDRTGREVNAMAYNFDDDSFTPQELTLYARHIGDIGFSQHRPVFARKPFSTAYWILNNGQIGVLTYHRKQEVIAWSRLTINGAVESISLLPTSTGYELWAHVRRVINGSIVRYIEIFEPILGTQSATTGFLFAGATTITGLSHLEGATVDVKLGNNYIGQLVVTAGTVNLGFALDANASYEVGLHYEPRWRSLRPAVKDVITEGHSRQWVQVVMRVKNSFGGKINGSPVVHLTDDRPYTGLIFANPLSTGNDYDGYLEYVQDQPYPITILTVAGVVNFAEHMQ